MAKVENNGKNKRKGRGLKIALIILLLIIVIIAAIFGGAYWYVEDKLGKMQQVKIRKNRGHGSTVMTSVFFNDQFEI